MNHAVLVGVPHCITELEKQLKRGRYVKCTRPRVDIERLALNVFHCEVITARLLATYVQTDDVWVIEPRCQLYLALEPPSFDL